MKRFRVLSDLHLDINRGFPIKISKDVFTVICGDTAGETAMGLKWINENVRKGLIISGNHLPYNDSMITIQQQRERLASIYPPKSSVTYLDAETGCYSKEVDGILFCGSCMYSNMNIKSMVNPTGDISINKRISGRNMNDFRYGIKSIDTESGKKTYITPDDYVEYFCRAYEKLDKVITENEKADHPLPIVLITHYPLVEDILRHSYYVDYDNWPSYGSDMGKWILSHPSIKCYCCGHAHDISEEYRHYYINRDDGSKCLVVNNSRGYVSRGHDKYFNKNTFVNVDDWTVVQKPLSKKEQQEMEKRQHMTLGMMSMFF